MTIGILFVCTANLCRSPTAEGVFRSLAARAGLADAFEFGPDLATAHGRKADADALLCHGS